jgi:hypothetical protein
VTGACPPTTLDAAAGRASVDQVVDEQLVRFEPRDDEDAQRDQNGDRTGGERPVSSDERHCLVLHPRHPHHASSHWLAPVSSQSTQPREYPSVIPFARMFANC